MIALVRNFSITCIRWFSIALIILLFGINVLFTTYTFTGWYPLVFDNSIVSSLGKILLAIFLFVFVYLLSRKLSNKQILLLLLLINLISFLVKILLIQSFDNAPVADTWFIFDGTDVLHYTDDPFYFSKGRYFATYPQQLGMTTLLLPITAIFRGQVDGYYYSFSIMMQLSILLLTYAAYRIKGLKAAFWTTVLMNIFLPNMFVIFLIYGEIFVVFYLSIATVLYFVSKSEELIQYRWLTWALFGLAVACAYLARLSTNVFILAFVSVLILLGTQIRRILVGVLFSTVILVATYPLNELIYNPVENNIGEFAQPSNTWIRLGLGYSGFDGVTPGFHDNQIDKDIEMFDYNSEAMAEYNSKLISKQWNELIQEGNLLNFYLEKTKIMWTDPDFEMMTIILPFAGRKFENPRVESRTEMFGSGAFDLKTISPFGNWLTAHYFDVRKAEKTIYFGYLLLFVMVFFKKDDHKDHILLFMRILTIGFFLLHQIIEIKSRYLYVYMNFMIFFGSLYVPTLLDALFDKSKKYFKRIS